MQIFVISSGDNYEISKYASNGTLSLGRSLLLCFKSAVIFLSVTAKTRI